MRHLHCRCEEDEMEWRSGRCEPREPAESAEHRVRENSHTPPPPKRKRERQQR